MSFESTPVMRVVDWSKRYENNRSRELKKLDWVPFPNRQDGDGYSQVIEHPNGAAHLGAWVALVQIASKCDPRGTLLRDGAKPHDAHSLSRMSRIPVEIFIEAIPRFMQVGWIELFDGAAMSQRGAVISHSGALVSHDGALKRSEGKWTEAPPSPSVDAACGPVTGYLRENLLELVAIAARHLEADFDAETYRDASIEEVEAAFLDLDSLMPVSGGWSSPATEYQQEAA